MEEKGSTMEYILLGRSGLMASVAGLGCGGPSRLGLRDNGGETEAIGIIRTALELGVNLLDTAEAYGTEEVVGKAIQEMPRERLLISTKKAVPELEPEEARREMRKGLEQSLRRLRTDYVDIYHLHGVTLNQYPFALNELVPLLDELRRQGKIRCVGLTEYFGIDPQHLMLQQALQDDWFDVVMVGFNLLNQSARERVLRRTIEKNVGVLIMFAIRRALSEPARFKQAVGELQQKGLVDPWYGSGLNGLELLLDEGPAVNYPDVAYRYCRHEPGVHVVLTGTGNSAHLKSNVESLLKPPLPDSSLSRLKRVFARVDCVTGG
jgi:aryl-alcohol dehydrogenase-like predicted oxidoreductase